MGKINGLGMRVEIQCSKLLHALQYVAKLPPVNLCPLTGQWLFWLSDSGWYIAKCHFFVNML